MKTVLIYVNTSKEVGDVDYLKVFANEEAMEKWFQENDPESVAFQYERQGWLGHHDQRGTARARSLTASFIRLRETAFRRSFCFRFQN